MNITKNVPHKHAEAIIAWANGYEIECICRSINNEWEVTSDPSWSDNFEYRVKQEKEYPKTTLSNESLYEFYVDYKADTQESLRATANHVIRTFIESGEMAKYVTAQRGEYNV